MKRPTVLMILDGFGLSEETRNNAIAQAKTPNIDRLMAECPFQKGYASGLAVGLPDGQMGNSEVGHMNMGAGRVVYQDLTRITKAIEDGDFFENPAMLAAIYAAKARGSDVIIIDTAGRLHNKQNLMNELGKIRRIIARELPESDVETLMVLDATTGQNGLIQAKNFLETASLTGIVLTKLDGTAKGGIIFAIANELGLPVKYVGVGEGIDDLNPFDAKSFVEALFK